MYKLLSIIPAQGWWALYDDHGCMFPSPLAAWGVFQDTNHKYCPMMSGMEGGNSGLPVTNIPNFVGYYLADDLPIEGRLQKQKFDEFVGKSAPSHWFAEAQ